MTTLDPRLVAFIKKEEGFAPVAKWDFRQWTNGYGTKAQHPNEAITPYEAEQRLDVELTKAVEAVERYAPKAPQGVKDALASLTFNSGTEWMSDHLGAAVKAGDYAKAKVHFLLYDHAGGKVLPDLQERRKEEAAWFPAEAPEKAVEAPKAADPTPAPAQAEPLVWPATPPVEPDKDPTTGGSLLHQIGDALKAII